MKSIVQSSAFRTVMVSFLIVLGFSLQSFKNVTGIQIEKRHYRKGYYVHLCHGVKNQPVTSVAPEKTSEKVAAVAVQTESSETSAEPIVQEVKTTEKIDVVEVTSVTTVFETKPIQVVPISKQKPKVVAEKKPVEESQSIDTGKSVQEQSNSVAPTSAPPKIYPKQ